MLMKNTNIGGKDDEKTLRFFKNEGTQEPLARIFKTTSNYAIGP